MANEEKQDPKREGLGEILFEAANRLTQEREETDRLRADYMKVEATIRELRSRHGARPGELFGDFVGRLVKERDEAKSAYESRNLDPCQVGLKDFADVCTVLGVGGQETLLEAAKRVAQERDAADRMKAECIKEREGLSALRSRCGARPGEFFEEFVNRLVKERDEARERSPKALDAERAAYESRDAMRKELHRAEVEKEASEKANAHATGLLLEARKEQDRLREQIASLRERIARLEEDWAKKGGDPDSVTAREHAVTEMKLAKACDLLQQWLQAPFFATQGECERWVAEFRPRVEVALDVNVKGPPSLKPETQGEPKRDDAHEHGIALALRHLGAAHWHEAVYRARGHGAVYHTKEAWQIVTEAMEALSRAAVIAGEEKPCLDSNG